MSPVPAASCARARCAGKNPSYRAKTICPTASATWSITTSNTTCSASRAMCMCTSSARPRCPLPTRSAWITAMSLKSSRRSSACRCATLWSSVPPQPALSSSNDFDEVHPMSFKPAPWPRKLRSQHWYGGNTRDAIYHRGWMKNQGYPPDLFDGRPVIGILNTWSDLTPCNGHLRELAEKVKAGVWEAGGFPVEVPVFSASENTFRPTAMVFRTLAALSIEETMRAQPIDGAVLLVGCDKTTPSLLMAAASTNIPSIVVSGGPMLNGWFQGERVGSGTHLWKFSEAVRAGRLTQNEFLESEQSMCRSSGTCNTMGTASTMASMAEALGMALSGNAAIPAVDSRRRVMAQMTGRRIVQMVKDDLKPSDILTRQAFENAIRTNGAIGGSTNAVIHLLALA